MLLILEVIMLCKFVAWWWCSVYIIAWSTIAWIKFSKNGRFSTPTIAHFHWAQDIPVCTNAIQAWCTAAHTCPANSENPLCCSENGAFSELHKGFSELAGHVWLQFNFEMSATTWTCSTRVLENSKLHLVHNLDLAWRELTQPCRRRSRL